MEIQGFCDDRFGAVREVFEANFAERGDVGQLTKLEREGYGHTKEAKRLRARIAKAKS